MLDHFQKAFADLTASPGLVMQVRENPDLLRDRYELSEREVRRLAAMVNDPGMECNCVLYRASRITPIAVHLPRLTKVLAKDLGPLLSEYWTRYTHTNINFLFDSYRFCEFVKEKIDGGFIFSDAVLPIVEFEMAELFEQLEVIDPDNYMRGPDGRHKICTAPEQG